MTCIVGVEGDDRTILLADSAGVAGWARSHRRDRKLHEILPATTSTPGIGLGFTTSYRMGQALGYGLRGWARGLNLTKLGDTPDARHEWAVLTLVPQVREVLSGAGWMKVESGREDAGTFLLAIGCHLFCIHGDLQVESRLDGWDAVGCGADMALGAMHAVHLDAETPERVAHAGIDAALYLSAGVGGRVDRLDILEREPTVPETPKRVRNRPDPGLPQA